MTYKTIKFLFLQMVLLLLVKTASAQTQTPTMPVFNSTEEKQAWITAHPTEYQQILTADSTRAAQNTAAQTATTSQQKTAQPAVPSDFPQYVNTGDKAKDDAAYAAAKAAWIQANPEKYKEMTGQPH